MQKIRNWFKKKNISSEIIIISCFFLLGTFLRFFHLGKESFWLDESYTASLIHHSPGNIIQIAANDVYPPLFYLFLHGLSKIITITEFTFRIPSAIFGSLSIIIIWKLCRSLYSSKVALLSAFFLTISPFHIQYSQESRAYSFLLFLILCSFLFLYELKQKPTFFYSLGYFLSIILAIWTHVMGIVFIGLQGLWIIFDWLILKKNLSGIKPFGISVCLAGLSYIPWISSLFGQIMKIDQGDFWLTQTTWVDLGSYVLLSSGSIAGLIISVPLILYFSIAWLKKEGVRSILYWAIGVPIIIWLASVIFVPFFTVRNMLPALPAFLILLSLIFTSIQYRPIAFSLILIFCISNMINLGTYFTVVQKDQWREAAIFLEDNMENDDLIYFDKSYGLSGIKWYLDNDLCHPIDEPVDKAWLVIYSITDDEIKQYIINRDITNFKNITIAFPVKSIN